MPQIVSNFLGCLMKVFQFLVNSKEHDSHKNQAGILFEAIIIIFHRKW